MHLMTAVIKPETPTECTQEAERRELRLPMPISAVCAQMLVASLRDVVDSRSMPKAKQNSG